MSEMIEKFGLGFRPQHYSWITTHCPKDVDVFEIVSENFMGVGGRPMHFLDKLRENYPVLMHGVGLSIGSHDPLDPKYLKALKKLADRVDPLMISDHLSWNQLHRRNTHDLLPIAYTQESLDAVVAKLHHIQEFLGRRFFLENASAYVAFREGDYDEAGFFQEMLKRSGAGILLDVNNLYVNQRNLGEDPLRFIAALRPEDVGYFHLAGHTDQGDVLVDTHDQPVPDSVWKLFAKVKEKFRHQPAIVEWDGNIPDIEVLIAEVNKARDYKKWAARTPEPTPARRELPLPEKLLGDNEANYGLFLEQIVKPYGITDEGARNLRSELPTPALAGLKVYNHAYFLRLEEVLADTYSALAYITEEEGFRHLIAAYLAAHPPMGSSLKDVGRTLPDFLRDPATELDYDFGVPLELLGDIAAVEQARADAFIAEEEPVLSPDRLQTFTPRDWEQAEFRLSNTPCLVRVRYHVLPVLDAIAKGELPDPPEESPRSYLIYRQGHAVRETEVSAEEARLLEALGQGAGLLDLCDASRRDEPGHYSTSTLSWVAGLIFDWTQKSCIQ